MTRPTVLIATTQPAMAYALGERLKQPCRDLGLCLEICPGGDGEKATNLNSDIRPYSCAEGLFDVLEKRNPMELADTLVVLDLGTQLTGAFEPKAPKDESWHVTDNRAGVAAELVLRFPQVFPVFLSPAVPVVGADDIGCCPQTDQDNWRMFHDMREALRIANKPKSGTPTYLDIDTLLALHIPPHFVSPLDSGEGLESTLGRFAGGMRCWFDPTGFRTLVRNQVLGTLFGNEKDWSNSWSEVNREDADVQLRRKSMLERLDKVVVAVDEEREFAMLNAYAAYKFGRRAWMVTSFAEFDHKPLWAFHGDKHVSKDSADVLILRDIDLRFADIPEMDVESRDPKPESVRDHLKNIHSGIWHKVCDNLPRLGDAWRVRAITSSSTIAQPPEYWCNEQKRLGERIGEYLGLTKPVGDIYKFNILLSDPDQSSESSKTLSLISRVGVINKQGPGGHGAPYVNLAMAESLLKSARECGNSTAASLMGAFLAGEAYQLLLGMSKTTALEALLLIHKKEVAAEVEFPGISHDIDIALRVKDVEVTLSSLELNRSNRSIPMRNMFLSQFWSEIRQIYRSGEQFKAAEKANVQSLIHSTWSPSWMSRWMPDFGVKHKLKLYFVVLPATSFFAWLLSFLIINSLLYFSTYFLYIKAKVPDPTSKINDLLVGVFLSFLSQSPTAYLGTIADKLSPVVQWFMVIHLSLSYVLLGMLIAMIYRKITRG